MSSTAAGGVPDYFTLLGLNPAFAIDVQALDNAYRDLQRRVHPDRFAASAGAEQRQAAQWSALANDAYYTLKQPVQRAHYLVQLRGIDFNHCTLPEGFLFAQLNLREAVHKARTARDTAALTGLKSSLQTETGTLHARLAQQLDTEQNYQRAAQTVLILQFYAKLVAELEDAMLEAEA